MKTNFYAIMFGMKRILLVLSIYLFVGFGMGFAAETSDMRGYDGIELAKGTFIPVISLQEISTQYLDEGSRVKFISTTDLYLHETNIIPQNTEFFGYIDKINEPVVGTNAAMVIKISRLRLPDGYELPMRGYIYTPNNNLIGGEMTAPASYVKKAAYRQGFYPMTGYVPGPARKMGEHKVIASGADLIIILAGPLYVTHTVTN